VDSLQKVAESPIAVVCHDAGATNLIVHWLKNYEGIIFPCMEGPAIRIWNFHFPEIKILQIEEAIHNAKSLLSGTGNSSFEHNARIKAQNKGLYSISVIDHWTAYKERFIFNNRKVLPDLILVGDSFAKQLAQSIFPLVKVVELNNLYLENEAKMALQLRKNPVVIPPKKVLAVMENFKVNPDDGRSLDFMSLDYLFENIRKIDKGQGVTIRIRPHPSELPNKYKVFEQKETNVEISDNLNLYQDLANSDLVVGMQSFAMVVSQHCNIPTVSILPPDSIECILPYRGILSLRDL
jgi:hypothetical protein